MARRTVASRPITADELLPLEAGFGGHPNILLLCADDHRADAIGGLGHALLRTPNWDRLVREGTAFTRIFAFDDDRPAHGFSPQLFVDAGYHTFFTGWWKGQGTPAEAGYGSARRVFTGDLTDQHLRFEEAGETISGFSSELFAEAAIGFLDSRRGDDTPWLARIAFTAPHDPRTPPVGWRMEPRRASLPPNFMPEHPFDNGAMTGRDELLLPWPRTEDDIRQHLADYYGMLLHLDAQVGRILAALDAIGQQYRTLVVYTSDSGLAIGSHGLLGKRNLYDHSTRIPLLMRGPGIPGDCQYDALGSAEDLLPTLCDLCDIPTPIAIPGLTLAPILRGETTAHRNAVFGSVGEVQRMIRTRRYKLIAYPQAGREQLFDLATDPHELVNLLDPWRFHPSPGYQPPSDGSAYRNIADDLRSRLTGSRVSA